MPDDSSKYKPPGLYQARDGELELVLPAREYSTLVRSDEYTPNPRARRARKGGELPTLHTRPAALDAPALHQARFIKYVSRFVTVARSPQWDPDAEAIYLRSARAVKAFVRDLISTSDQEILLTLVMAEDDRLLGVHVTGVGVLDTVMSAFVDSLKVVLLLGGKAYWTVHNHPSGAEEPSAGDMEANRIHELCSELYGVVFKGGLVVAFR